MSKSNTFSLLASIAGPIYLNSLMDTPEKRASLRSSIVDAACAAVEAGSGLAGVVCVRAPAHEDCLAAARDAWLEAEPSEPFPLDEAGCSSNASLSRLFTVLESVPCDWERNLRSILDGIPVEVAARCGKSLASCEAREAVSEWISGSSKEVRAEGFGPGDLAAFDTLGAAHGLLAGAGAPKTVELGFVDAEVLSEAIRFDASFDALRQGAANPKPRAPKM